MQYSGEIAALRQALHERLPNAHLSIQRLPDTPLKLWLLAEDWPRGRLPDEVVQRLWQDTPYWIFCWASGLAMARWLLAEPWHVAGKTVVDFGTGSGVVAIAAALAGAKRVIACDIDGLSLQVTAANAQLNGVSLEYLDDIYVLTEPVDVLLAADVLYDQANRFFLDVFLQRAKTVFVADSRVKNFEHRHYIKQTSQTASTWPDLDESPEFRNVSFYSAVAPQRGLP